MRRELGTLYSDNVTTISVDDMAKILSNALAVSPYLQIKRFFAEGDSPNFDDHDFPVPGYLLFVSGYMFLNLNENTSDSEFNGSNLSLWIDLNQVLKIWFQMTLKLIFLLP